MTEFFCRNCGELILSSWEYCPNCGTKLTSDNITCPELADDDRSDYVDPCDNEDYECDEDDDD